MPSDADKCVPPQICVLCLTAGYLLCHSVNPSSIASLLQTPTAVSLPLNTFSLPLRHTFLHSLSSHMDQSSIISKLKVGCHVSILQEVKPDFTIFYLSVFYVVMSLHIAGD
ncbi:hypothetical protein BsWGS_06972 [Bradybaena similaris]